MFVNMIFNRGFALLLFMAGIWMGSMMDPVFGIITILAGLLLGFSDSFKSGKGMDKKVKVLFFATFTFLFLLMSLTYLAITIYFL